MTEAKPSKPRVIAFYLPQYHPIPENDAWWGKGFTEWTNVGKARPLFRGHYQPRVPADLGYYDLRVPETREAQAAMAREHGVEGFCYWHYWFGSGKRLLERPFTEVLQSGKPDYPFCLGWANHSWKDKSWAADGSDKLLVEQRYPGPEDEEFHFRTLLPALLDKRYIRVNDRPLFMIWDPKDMPDVSSFMRHWNVLARQKGIDGFHFVTIVADVGDAQKVFDLGFSAVTLDLQTAIFKNNGILDGFWHRFRRRVLHTPKCIDFGVYGDRFMSRFRWVENVYPQILSNWDHSPRSGGKSTVILTDSSPAKFERFLGRLFEALMAVPAEENLVFIRSWNEWAEGNHLEPDLKYGKGHLVAIKRQLDKLL